jgi:excisionase family DNA binding protein
MDGKYYTVEQIAEMLQIHPKTIQRYIREGKLRANKIGKAWRINGHDLSLFMENGKVIYPNNETGEPFCKISSVIDIGPYQKEKAARIISHFAAALNGRGAEEYKSANMQAQYIEPEQTVRISLWGDLNFMQTMLSMIDNI